MSVEGILLEKGQGIAHIVLDRPPVNAVSTEMYELLIDTLTQLGDDQASVVVLLRSANPRIFCAGADIRQVQGAITSDTQTMDEQRQALARTAYHLLLNLPQPTIAVVHGPALGAGAVLAACCDLRIGSDAASFALPEINVARCGGGRHLLRLLPQAIVRRMSFTGQPIDARDALRLGFLNEVHSPGEELSAALDLAGVLAAKSPVALRYMKRALNASEDLSIDDGYRVEQEYTVKLGRTADAREAANAFLEKRSPVWSGA